ncbi:hypothetical protein PoB_006893900 [Plakobranchus ocellatus]|uniref:CCHC-type domain-containing protein n=1 Tax=Plakobranchus ocellatus TaxID=259542 RepID=A0AAV4DE78_9GAST|nr:hypothetical protein PoB_006893900 [Plakobranchus ocellatus]
MDGCPAYLAVYIRGKVFRDLQSVGEKVDLYLFACTRSLCDHQRRSTQVGALSVDSMRPREAGLQRAEEPRTSTSNQRLCLKCKRYGHIAPECTYSSPSAKKADAGLIAMAPRRHEKRFSSKRRSCSEGDGQPESEVKDRMLQVASGKALQLSRTARHRKSKEDERSPPLLAEKAVVNLRTPPQDCGEVKALCIPDAICYAIVGNVEGARGPENPDMSVMMSGVTTRAQALRETATRTLQMLPTRSATVELIVTS